MNILCLKLGAYKNLKFIDIGLKVSDRDGPFWTIIVINKAEMLYLCLFGALEVAFTENNHKYIISISIRKANTMKYIRFKLIF